MTIDTIREVSCNGCFAAIGHYWIGQGNIRKVAKEEGFIARGKLHFCDETCL